MASDMPASHMKTGCLDPRQSYSAKKVSVPDAPVRKQAMAAKPVPAPKGGM